ncbi:MAG: hypothetical protein II541_10800, partial [Prevotella sp.]|nr:hypothetical protein [Prevotella sp.]
QGNALSKSVFGISALQGQKHLFADLLLRLQRVLLCVHFTQGVALSYKLVGLSGRLWALYVRTSLNCV